MKMDGMLEKAQFEGIAASTASPSPLGRIYADTTDPTNVLPKFYDGSIWSTLLKRNKSYSTATTTATIGADIELHRMDGSGAAFTSTLPPVASMSGKTIKVIKIDSTFNACTVKGNASELIDGSNTIQLSTYQEWVELLCLGGTSWTVIGSGYYQGTTAWTPTGSWSTNTTYTGSWWRLGNRIFLEIHLALAGAPTAATLTLNLMNGVTISTAGMTSAVQYNTIIGKGHSFHGGSKNPLIVYYDTTTRMEVHYQYSNTGTANPLYDAVVNATAPQTFANLDSLDILIPGIPVVGWRG